MKIKKKIRILITCLGGRRALDLINILKKDKIYDYEIFGSDIKKNLMIKNKINKFYQVPKGQTKEFIKRIIEIIKKNQIKLAIFGADEEVLNISKNRYLFKNLDCFIPIMEKKKLNIISNKLNLFKNLEKKKISLAKWNIIRNLSDLKKFSFKFKNNFVLKNSDSRGGRDVFIIDKKIKQPKKISTGSQEIHLNNVNSFGWIKSNNLFVEKISCLRNFPVKYVFFKNYSAIKNHLKFHKNPKLP